MPLFLFPIFGALFLTVAMHDELDKQARSKQKDLPQPFYDEFPIDSQLSYKGKIYKLFALFTQETEPDFSEFIVYKHTDLGKFLSDSSFFCVYRKIVNDEVVDYYNYGFVNQEQFKELSRNYSSRSGWSPAIPLPDCFDDNGQPTTCILV